MTHSTCAAICCCFAIDNETTKLAIPTAFVRKTVGLQRTTPTPALCRLFMKDRCRQGSQCHQIHADVHVVEQLRRAVLAAPPCCQMHTPSSPHTAFDPSRLIVMCGEAVPVSLFCPTVGLRKALEKQSSGANAKDLCRSHVSGGLCRYGDDCNYLHLCKTLSNRFPEAAAISKKQQLHATFDCEASPEVIANPLPHGAFREGSFVEDPCVLLHRPYTPLVLPPFRMPSCVVPTTAAQQQLVSAASCGSLIHRVDDEWRTYYFSHAAAGVDDVSIINPHLCHPHHCSVLRDSPMERSNSPLSNNKGEDGGLSTASSPNASATSSPWKTATNITRWSHNPYAKPSAAVLTTSLII